MRPIQGNIATGMPVDNNIALVDAYRRDFPRRCGARLARKAFDDAVDLSALCLLNVPPRQCVHAQGWPPTTKLCQGQPPPCPGRSLETGFQDEALDEDRRTPSRTKPWTEDQRMPSRTKPWTKDQRLPSRTKPWTKDQRMPSRTKPWTKDQRMPSRTKPWTEDQRMPNI